MQDLVRQETIQMLVREAARELGRQRALLAMLEKSADGPVLTEARQILRDLEERFASYRHELGYCDHADS